MPLVENFVVCCMYAVPDEVACVALAGRVVNASAPCAAQEHDAPCALGVTQPHPRGQFHALSGFHVVCAPSLR